jgi:hypothetical protein
MTRRSARRGTAAGSSQQGTSHILGEAERWARENRALLEVCFSEFNRSGKWPTLTKLEHRLELDGSTTSARSLVGEMPVPLGFVEQERLVLLCRGLLQIEGTERLLDDWFRSVRKAFFDWMHDPDVVFGSEQVSAIVDDDEGRLRRVSTLLLRESWMFGSGSGDASGPWTREVDPGVREARDASNAHELLDARAAVEWSDFEPPSETKWWIDLWRYASNNPLIAGLLVVAIIALIGSGYKLISGSSGPGVHGSHQTKVERAGEGGARAFPEAGVLAREGPAVQAGQKVEVLCRVYAPRPASALPEGWWYKLGSSPWDGRYFATANSFWNGDVPGQRPYTHYADFSVPRC